MIVLTASVSTPVEVRKMAIRKIIEIDEERCDGCGQCVLACAEGALRIVDGKAKVVSDGFCDGLGACIGECPQDALRIIEREAPEFDEEAVKDHLGKEGGRAAKLAGTGTEPCGCPSSNPMLLKAFHGGTARADTGAPADKDLPSELMNWPVQWRLVQPTMPFFKGSDLLLAADCVPFALRDFHDRFLKGRPVIIGCPKLDDQATYLDRLTAVFRDATPKSVTVVIMEVPCCQGLLRLVQEATRRSGKDIPLKTAVIGIEGQILKET